MGMFLTPSVPALKWISSGRMYPPNAHDVYPKAAFWEKADFVNRHHTKNMLRTSAYSASRNAFTKPGDRASYDFTEVWLITSVPLSFQCVECLIFSILYSLLPAWIKLLLLPVHPPEEHPQVSRMILVLIHGQFEVDVMWDDVILLNVSDAQSLASGNPLHKSR